MSAYAKLYCFWFIYTHGPSSCRLHAFMICYMVLQVRQFMEGLQPGALVADVGCGNGKYFLVRQDIAVLGSDRSTGLAQVAATRLAAGTGAAPGKAGQGSTATRSLHAGNPIRARATARPFL